MDFDKVERCVQAIERISKEMRESLRLYKEAIGTQDSDAMEYNLTLIDIHARIFAANVKTIQSEIVKSDAVEVPAATGKTLDSRWSDRMNLPRP